MSEDNLAEIMRKAIWYEIDNKLHTAIPATVSKYNPDGPTVEAKPIIPRQYDDGTLLKYLPIVEVPVMFPRTNRFRMTFPLEEGDGVLLICSERSIEAWLQEGKELAPSSTTKYSLTDAIAIPGLFAMNKGSKIENGGQLELVFDNVRIISDGEKVTIDTSGNFELNGNADSMVKESVLNSMLSTMITDLSLIGAFETVFAAQWLIDAPILTTQLSSLASTKNKLG